MPRSDTAVRARTRLLLMYNLTPQVQVPDDMLRPLTEALDLGRFTSHVEAAGLLLPRLVLHERVSEITLPPSAARVDGAAVTLAVTPRRDPLLFVDVEIEDDPDGSNMIAETLYATWQDRSATRVGGVPLTEWLDERLRAYGVTARPAGQPPLAFGRNVHQSVFLGEALARQLLAEHTSGEAVGPDVVTIVLRGTLDNGTGATLGIRRPETLNNPGQTMVAHGRGVSLIVGYAPPVENAFGLAAAGILNAVAAVHRIRRQAFEALELDRAAVVETADDARTLVARLSRRLSDLQLDLSFSVEAYADTVLIPELLVESFHSSLRAVSALTEALANTSRIVERVNAVLATRRVDLETASQRYAEGRDRVLAAAIAAGSVIALPPALLLAFFGVNSSDVDPRRSILDIHHYGVAYAIAWLPFLLLIAVGLVARRRVSLRLSAPDTAMAGRRRTRRSRLRRSRRHDR
ncbi:hypothetical protein [Streptomyces sp. NBC_00557]|uniref:hypothetical protein n=1 Tax=Streptomyces sp. NBC_00557 TaxID=2975776 RepID=UPI002E823A6A|nr:hypothetical protein [Streptomyces sp. NBC_00557]WUC32910.1 hypothetical protein OG956_01090 [Streptomyces sp. NBC_00557]